MITRSTPVTDRKLIWGLTGVGLLLLLSGLAINLSIGSPSEFEFASLIAVVYSVLAIIIIARQPRHTVGWLFLIVGYSSALNYFLGSLRFLPVIANSDMIRSFLIWMGSIIWIPSLMLPITMVLLYFPNGKLPSPRWWPVPAISVIGIIGFAFSIALYPWPWAAQEIFETYNPFGIAGAEQTLESLHEVSGILFGVGLLGSVVAIIVRFWHSRGKERIQMKWLVYTATISIGLLVFGPSGGPLNDFIFSSIPVLLGVAISIAILRHQLFDIDIIIRRTLQYAILTGFLALIYFGGIVTLQGIIGLLTGSVNSPVVTVITTLGIAALFNPLRIRIQDFIDQRFYRAKYDAEQTLASFAETARDEVDMDKLTAALLGVVDETMQPESSSLWIQR